MNIIRFCQQIMKSGSRCLLFFLLVINSGLVSTASAKSSLPNDEKLPGIVSKNSDLPAPLSVTNLAPNPSFEEGSSQPNGWAPLAVGATYTWSSTNAHAGSRSICISNMSGNSSGEWGSQQIPVQPNQKYNASIWVRGDSNREAYYMISPKDANGNWLIAHAINIPYNNSSWTLGSFVYTPLQMPYQ